jgi:hypothetical protein
VVGGGAALAAFFGALGGLGAAREADGSARAVAAALALSLAGIAGGARIAGGTGALAGFGAGPLAGAAIAAGRLFRALPAERAGDAWAWREGAARADAGLLGALLAVAFFGRAEPRGAAAALGYLAAAPGLAVGLLRLEPAFHAAYGRLFAAAGAGASGGAIAALAREARAALRRAVLGVVLLGAGAALAGGAIAQAVVGAAGFDAEGPAGLAFRHACAGGAAHAALVLVLALLVELGGRAEALGVVAVTAALSVAAGFPAGAAAGAFLGGLAAIRAAGGLERRALLG